MSLHRPFAYHARAICRWPGRTDFPFPPRGAFRRSASDCIVFHPGPALWSNGQALALMARRRRRNVKLLLLCTPGEEQHVSHIGECVPPPVDLPSVVTKSEQLLQDSPALPEVEFELTS